MGSVCKGGVNVCQRRLVNEVLGPLVTKFVRNFGCEGATPIQRGSNASVLGRVQAIKLIRHRCSNFYPEAQIHKWLSKKCGSLSKKVESFDRRSQRRFTGPATSFVQKTTFAQDAPAGGSQSQKF